LHSIQSGWKLKLVAQFYWISLNWRGSRGMVFQQTCQY